MATITRGHLSNAERYQFDFGDCSYEKGWAQFDTKQDASYYGTWVHATRFLIFNYCEGDTTLTKCDDEDDFKVELRRLVDWNKECGYFLGIDVMTHPALEGEFRRLGFGDCLH